MTGKYHLKIYALTALLLIAGSIKAETTDSACYQGALTVETELLTVLTLNLAHGRKDGLNQALQSADQIESNLDEAAVLLQKTGADIIGLQEADAQSKWSGHFNHVEYIAHAAGYHCIQHGLHAKTSFYEFGTALLSKTPYRQTLTYDFKPTPPTTTKGFVLGEILWNPGGQLEQPLEVTFVSVHLDFSRKSVRKSQISALTRALESFQSPLIIMGDFNTTWDHKEALLKQFADDAGLHAYKPSEEGLGTYKNGKSRLDWILISQDLEFVDFVVQPETVSDHSAIRATIKYLPAQ